MKKIYFVFFLSVIMPLFLTAQQKPVSPPQTPVQKSILPAPKATQPKQTKQASSEKQPMAAPAGKGKPAPKRRIKHGPVTYGDEWINYSQFYYKIKVGQNGIYRIDSLTLARAGITVGGIDTNQYELFFRGQQQYIYVRSHTAALSEKNGDYIEFYGQYNDATEDSLTYYNIQFLPNPYFSLFTDTSTYYLTWNLVSNSHNNRMKEQTDTIWTDGGTAAPYVMTSTIIAARAISNAPSNNRASNIDFQNPYGPATNYFPGSWTPDGDFTPNDPRFTQNSAWTTIPWITYNSGQTFDLNVNNTYTTGVAPPAFLRTVVLGVDNGNCTITISSNFGAIYNNIPFNTYINFLTAGYFFRAMDTTYTFPVSDIPTKIEYYNNDVSNTQIITPTYIYLSYPHTPNLNNDTSFVMQIPDNVSGPGKSYLNFNSFYTSNPSDTVRLYDLTNHNRFWVKAEGGGFKVVVPNNVPSGGVKQCYMTSDYAVNKVTNLTPAGTNYSNGGTGNGLFTNFSSEPDSAYIIITHPSLWSSALNYKSYRSNRYNTVIANVQELYDQFGYGVDYSPLGIRNFCNYAIDKWASPPSNLFLIGKGIHTPLFRSDTAVWSRSQLLVPSFGYPSSDILFTNGLNGDSALVPAIPTGRLAAANNTEVADYLNKVKIFESAPAAIWMKRIALFAGGVTASEENIYASDLENYAATIADTLFGAHAYLFQKSTSASISGTLTDSIVNLIDSGVSIMNFFGHAAGSNWDESVDFPSDYNNNNRYPFMIADACFSGDIFEPIGDAVTSVSEQWVLGLPGAIGFLASDYLGDPSPLNGYTGWLYRDISYRPFYRKPMGQIVQNTIANVGVVNPNVFMTSTCLELTLHCDPAIALNAMDSLPDYAVNNQSIFFTPSNVTVLLDSFKVNVVVYNYAEALNQRVSGILTRTFPNGHVQLYPFTVAPPPGNHYLYYTDTISIKVPVNDSNIAQGAGFNYFSLSVDLNPNLPEITLTNNSINNVLLWITSEDVTPIWPYDYAIIPNDTVTLKASTNDPFAPQRTYIFEIDTSHSFNSPLFRSDTVTNSGGVIMASPFANWGTTHFNGLYRGTPGTNKMTVNNTAGNKGVFSQSKQSISTNASTSVKAEMNIAPTTSSTFGEINKMTPAPQGSLPLSKQPAMAGIPVTSSSGLGGQKNNIIPEKAGRKRGPINESFKNGYVYYWRVRRDTADSTGIYNWVNTSFQYIQGKNGWGQSNFYQYDNDEITNDNNNFITYNNPPRGWAFNPNGHTLQCTTYGMLNLCENCIFSTNYTIDNSGGSYGGCQYNWGIYVVVIDPTTPTTPWSTAAHNGLGNINNIFNESPAGEQCIYPDSKFIFWDNNPTQMQALVTMLKDSVPNGDYILAYSFYEGAFKAPALQNASAVVAEFASLGATQMPYHASTPGLDSVPWIFFVQKGVPGTAKQIFGTTSVTSNTTPIGPGLQLSVDLKGNGTNGSITTPLIGPAAKYDSLSWFQHAKDADSTRLNVIGVEPNGTAKTLMSGITPTVANLYISSINPTLFPCIQLMLYTKDVVGHPPTPAQMNWWRVFYQPVPEIAMNPNIYTYYHADTVQYGDVLKFQTTVQNVSDWPIASTQLLTWTANQTNAVTYYNPGQMVKALNPGDTAKISFSLTDPNASINTMQSVWFEINPEDYPNTRLEQYHFNDYAEKTFYSYGDKINPVMDVTFNGIHILNNDIVSAQPSILITFMDENKFLALNNANNFKVYLNPIGGTPTLIPFGPTLSFTPAVLPQNHCSLLLTPTLPDGNYQLTIQGTDISGNLSGSNSYTIDFQVINKSMITEVLNYPNPFSTSTRFVFILTGSEIPSVFKIQIMTVTGKVIREINEDEIGPIHIGRNITQYAWDGTDKYGSRLANGVYLYRVITSINGQGIDEYQQGYQGANVDQYFTKGWGKMYLMR